MVVPGDTLWECMNTIGIGSGRMHTDAMGSAMHKQALPENPYGGQLAHVDRNRFVLR
jgi:hypothetical protein